ncbi:MAG: peptide-methionine (S)-S-oxide reductase MsrA [Alteraurantiacibacter sp.]
MNLKAVFAAAALACVAIAAWPASAEDTFNAPAATRVARETGTQTAIFAGGCFWGIEAIFSHTRGVTSAVSGYHGGSAADAHYRTIGSGRTGHAEAVRVTYDPAIVRYDQLLQILFSVGADPTQLNRQGPDRGTQYRSAIVPLTAEQRAVATGYLAQLRRSNVWDDPIVVAIENHQRFYPAEDYHQDYLLHNGDNPYIVRWDAPKVAALRTMFPRLWRTTYRAG